MILELSFLSGQDALFKLLFVEVVAFFSIIHFYILMLTTWSETSLRIGAELSFLFPSCLALPTLLPFGRGTEAPTRRIREGLATLPGSLPVPPLPSAQRGVPLGMARWTSLWLMGMVSAPQGPKARASLFFLLLLSWQRCPPPLHARQPAKAPGGHINYIAAPPLFSHVYLWVCLLTQTMPIWSLSISTAVYNYLLCVWFNRDVHKYSFAYALMHTCSCTHSFSISQAGHNGWWGNPPQRALIATGSAVQ